MQLRRPVNIVVDFITMSCMAYLGYYSITLVQNIKASGEFSPAMQWPMWFVYLFMLIGFALGTIRGIQIIIYHIQHFGDKELTTLEQTMQDAAKEAELAKEDDK